MDDSGPVGLAFRSGQVDQIGKAGQQAVDHRPVTVARPGMDDQTGRLVDDDNLVVDPDDRHIDGRIGLETDTRLHRDGTVDGELLIALHPPAVRLTTGRPEIRTRPGVDQGVDLPAAEAR